jgi:hypothetical protein
MPDFRKTSGPPRGNMAEKPSEIPNERHGLWNTKDPPASGFRIEFGSLGNGGRAVYAVILYENKWLRGD